MIGLDGIWEPDDSPEESEEGKTKRLRGLNERLRNERLRDQREVRERSERERRANGISKSTYMPSPAMAQLMREQLAHVEIPIGSSCERYELEH